MSLCWFFALQLRINPTARSTFAFPSHLAQLNPEDSCGAFFHLRQYDPASDLESHFSIRFGAILDDQNDTLALKFVSHIHDSKSLHPSSRPEDFEMKWEEPMKLMDLTRSYPRFRCDPSLYEFESCGGFLPTFAAEAWNCVSWVQLELHISWVAECIILSLENIWTYDEHMIFKVNHSASFLNLSLFACFRRSSTNGRHIPSFVDRWSRNLTQSFSGADRWIVDQNSRKNMEGSWRILVISKVCEVHQWFYPTTACSLYSWSETTPTMSLDKSWQRVWTCEASLGRDWTGLSWWYSVTSTIRGPAEVQCSNLSWRSWWRWKAAEVFGWCRKEQLLQNLQRALMVKKVTHCIFCDWSLFQNQNMAVGMHLNKKAEPGLGFFGELHVCMFYVFFLFFSL